MKLYGKAHETAQTILEAFQHADSLPKALAPIFIHRKDDIPCRKWSWRNQLLNALAGTTDARGYRQWQAVDRHVKKGSKAFCILSPCTKKIKDATTGEELYACYGFRATSVFRLEDTEGADLRSGDPEIDRWFSDLPLLEVAKSWGITVSTFSGQGARYLGYYRHGQGKAIALGVQNLSTFFHELMHAADYRLGNATERGQHWRKETVAEFGGAVLAECLGLEVDADLGGAFRYIEYYAKAAEKTVQAACMDCLDRICQSVALVLDTAEALKAESASVAV